jgi:hypothetical protein
MTVGHIQLMNVLGAESVPTYRNAPGSSRHSPRRFKFGTASLAMPAPLLPFLNHWPPIRVA